MVADNEGSLYKHSIMLKIVAVSSFLSMALGFYSNGDVRHCF